MLVIGLEKYLIVWVYQLSRSCLTVKWVQEEMQQHRKGALITVYLKTFSETDKKGMFFSPVRSPWEAFKEGQNDTDGFKTLSLTTLIIWSGISEEQNLKDRCVNKHLNSLDSKMHHVLQPGYQRWSWKYSVTSCQCGKASVCSANLWLFLSQQFFCV